MPSSIFQKFPENDPRWDTTGMPYIVAMELGIEPTHLLDGPDSFWMLSASLATGTSSLAMRVEVAVERAALLNPRLWVKQTDYAPRYGITQPDWSNVLNGSKPFPTAANKKLLASDLSVPLDWLEYDNTPSRKLSDPDWLSHYRAAFAVNQEIINRITFFLEGRYTAQIREINVALYGVMEATPDKSEFVYIGYAHLCRRFMHAVSVRKVTLTLPFGLVYDLAAIGSLAIQQSQINSALNDTEGTTAQVVEKVQANIKAAFRELSTAIANCRPEEQYMDYERYQKALAAKFRSINAIKSKLVALDSSKATQKDFENFQRDVDDLKLD